MVSEHSIQTDSQVLNLVLTDPLFEVWYLIPLLARRHCPRRNELAVIAQGLAPSLTLLALRVHFVALDFA